MLQPALLNLYDTHYLPLQGALRPIMKSFILALLPGLEEETGEFFEKVKRNCELDSTIPNSIPGTRSLGSALRHCLPRVLLPEHLAGDAHHAWCPRDSS